MRLLKFELPRFTPQSSGPSLNFTINNLICGTINNQNVKQLVEWGLKVKVSWSLAKFTTIQDCSYSKILCYRFDTNLRYTFIWRIITQMQLWFITFKLKVCLGRANGTRHNAWDSLNAKPFAFIMNVRRGYSISVNTRFHLDSFAKLIHFLISEFSLNPKPLLSFQPFLLPIQFLRLWLLRLVPFHNFPFGWIKSVGTCTRCDCKQV